MRVSLPLGALAAWHPAPGIVREIAQSNRASRTWLADCAGKAVVVKLTYDWLPAVAPGFRVAEHVQRHTGVLTGLPVRTAAGELAVELDEHPWTLAVMEYVEGAPLTEFSAAAARRAGELLATVHRALAGADVPTVPAHALDFFDHRAAALGQPDVAAAASAVRTAVAERGLPCGVLYGDPSPELLVTPSGDLALIDWGTPSFGPFAYDVATWAGHVGDSAQHFLDEYQGVMGPVPPDVLAACQVLWASLLEPA